MNTTRIIIIIINNNNNTNNKNKNQKKDVNFCSVNEGGFVGQEYD
jgi:hypothetical protein